MRFRALPMWVVVPVFAVAGGCADDQTAVHSGGVSFLLDGVAYDFSRSVTTDQGRLSLDAGNGDVSIHLDVSPYPGTFAMVPEDGAGPPSSAGGVVNRNGERYSTHTGGGGQVVIDHYVCQTSALEDPITGVTGSQTICNVAARFEFTARSETGASVSVTRGHWTARFRRNPSSCGIGSYPAC